MVEAETLQEERSLLLFCVHHVSVFPVISTTYTFKTHPLSRSASRCSCFRPAARGPESDGGQVRGQDANAGRSLSPSPHPCRTPFRAGVTPPLHPWSAGLRDACARVTPPSPRAEQRGCQGPRLCRVGLSSGSACSGHSRGGRKPPLPLRGERRGQGLTTACLLTSRDPEASCRRRLVAPG